MESTIHATSLSPQECETTTKTPEQADTDVNVLGGTNKVDVDIEPDVKDNTTHLQLCSCSVIFNCFTRNSVAKNWLV